MPGRGGCIPPPPPPKLRVADAISIMGTALDILEDGLVEIEGSAAVDLTGAVTISQGGSYRGIFHNEEPPSGSLTAGNVLITADEIGSGEMLLTNVMTLAVAGNLSVECVVGGRGGCIPPPPTLRVLDSAMVVVNGELVLVGDIEVEVGEGSVFALAGDFENQCTTPLTFNWVSGPLTMNGDGQFLEAAGEDRGADASGFVDNFAMGTLELADQASVNVIDAFPNQVDEPCEALYVDILRLNPGSEFTTGGCKVYYNNLENDGGSIPGLGIDVLNIVGCLVDADCDDADDCTVDTCEPENPEAEGDGCIHEYQQRLFGDVIPSFCPPTCPQPDLDDITCLLDDFGDGPSVDGCAGSAYSTDLAPCGGDGLLDLDDILSVLDAFAQIFACPHPCP